MHNTIKPINQYTKAYFLGIGGIGMSAIARYLLHIGWRFTVMTKQVHRLRMS